MGTGSELLELGEVVGISLLYRQVTTTSDLESDSSLGAKQERKCRQIADTISNGEVGVD